MDDNTCSIGNTPVNPPTVPNTPYYQPTNAPTMQAIIPPPDMASTLLQSPTKESPQSGQVIPGSLDQATAVSHQTSKASKGSTLANTSRALTTVTATVPRLPQAEEGHTHGSGNSPTDVATPIKLRPVDQSSPGPHESPLAGGSFRCCYLIPF